MRIMVLVQSPRDPSMEASYARWDKQLKSYASVGTTIELHFPDDYPGARVYEAMGDRTVLTGLHHALEVPALVKKTVWAQENGFDAVIQSNTFDPGVDAGRLAVKIPVIGLFRSSLNVARMLGNRIGVLVPLDGHVPYTWRLLASYGADRFVHSVRAIGVYDRDLISRREEITALANSKLAEMVATAGVEVVIPLGGALIPYVVDPAELGTDIGLPVLNTKAIGVSIAEMCVRHGLTQSPLAYPYIDLPLQTYEQTAFAPSI